MLITVNNDMFDFSFVGEGDLFISIATVLAGLFGTVIVMILGGTRFVNSNMFKRVALADVQEKSQGYTSSFYSSDLVGKKGITYTVLRPSGKIEIEGTIYDAYTRGNYVGEKVEIEVISAEGTSLKVKEV